MYLEFSAGGVVYKQDPDWQILLIQPEDSKRPSGWSLPKGTIEKGEKADAAALREVKEEAGVEAEVVQKIDDIEYFFRWQGELVKKKVRFFLMKYLSGEPTCQAGETSAAVWHKAEAVLPIMAYKGEKEIVEKAITLISNI